MLFAHFRRAECHQNRQTNPPEIHLKNLKNHCCFSCCRSFPESFTESFPYSSPVVQALPVLPDQILQRYHPSHPILQA